MKLTKLKLKWKVLDNNKIAPLPLKNFKLKVSELEEMQPLTIERIYYELKLDNSLIKLIDNINVANMVNRLIKLSKVLLMEQVQKNPTTLSKYYELESKKKDELVLEHIEIIIDGDKLTKI